MLNAPRNAFAFVGRHATIAYALSIVLGLGLPQLAATLRPFIPISIFVFIMLAFARANLPGLRIVLSQPARLGRALLISALVPPIVGWMFLASPLAAGIDPALRLGIALMAAAPPLMASPVYALLLGFENSLALTVLVLGMVVTPLTAPVLATLLAGTEVPISPIVLAQRLALFIGGGMLAGLTLRHFAGVPKLTEWKNELDGVGVLMFFLFAIAAMDGVIDATLADPMHVFGMLGLSTLLAAISFLICYLAMRGTGFNDQFSVSICVGLRNMGLLITPILSIAPKTTFLYFALAQIPIYVAPMILRATKHWLDPARKSPASKD